MQIDHRVWPGVLLLAALALLNFIFLPATFAWVWLVLIFVHVAFFRDPVRKPEGEGVLAPADGKVTEISYCDENNFIKGSAVKIGIFLSVFDVHVNRMPWQGTVEWQKHMPGKFLDARHPDCSAQNECNWVGCRDGSRKFVVRQISGLIARHIYSDVKEGQALTRGQKIGVICYGSRAELYLPAGEFQPLVQVGDVVKSSATVLGLWK